MCLAAAAVCVSGCKACTQVCEGEDECRAKSAATPVCMDGRCVRCGVDEHCAVCQRCAGNTCHGIESCCTRDVECRERGERCWPVAGGRQGQGRCGPECVSGEPNRACPEGQRCVRGACASVPAAPATTCELAQIHFDYREHGIADSQRRAVEANAACLRTLGKPIRIAGHCDDRGSDEFNLALGTRRALAVKRQYEMLGVMVHMDTTSFGEEIPVCQAQTEACWASNRRVETSWAAPRPGVTPQPSTSDLPSSRRWLSRSSRTRSRHPGRG